MMMMMMMMIYQYTDLLVKCQSEAFYFAVIYKFLICKVQFSQYFPFY